MIVYIFLIILSVWCIFLNVHIVKLNRYRKVRLERGLKEEITDYLDKLVSELDNEKQKIKTLENTVRAIKNNNRHSIKKIGIERFDIADAGGRQSFSLALLDENNCGVIIRGLFTRDSSRVYCIKIDKENTDRQLLPEDIKALKNATEN